MNDEEDHNMPWTRLSFIVAIPLALAVATMATAPDRVLAQEIGDRDAYDGDFYDRDRGSLDGYDDTYDYNDTYDYDPYGDDSYGYDTFRDDYGGADNERWWENNPYYNEDEWYDPTDWFDGNNYEFDRDAYDAYWNEGTEDNAFGSKWD
jgi:hypothetical protein